MPEPEYPAEGFDTLEALRTAHLDFMKRATALKETPAGLPSESVRAFIARARVTGTRVVDERQREAAQRILDYWSAELLACADARPEDFRPALLARPAQDAVADEDGHRESGEGAESEDQSRKRLEARQLIRLAAQARQWRDSSGAQGYLLTGDALEEAARHREDDPDIAAFVAASEKAEQEATRQAGRTKNRVIAALSVLALLALGVAGYAYMQREEARAQTAIAVEQKDRAEQEKQELEKLIAANREQQLAFENERAGLAAQLEAAIGLIDKAVQDGRIERGDVPESLKDRIAYEPPPELDVLASPDIKGYDPRFLGLDLPLPELADAILPFGVGGGSATPYPNYSIITNGVRRMPIVAASNLDRALLLDIPRTPTRFRFDPRIAMEFQADPAWFAGNTLDRGHVVSRQEIAWGPFFAGDSATAARRLSGVIDVYSNVAPQFNVFNQKIWSGLERWVLTEHNPDASQVSIFTGPVLDPGDPEFFGVRVPRAFWKIAVSRATPDSDALEVDAFLVPQLDDRQMIAEERPFAAEEFRTTVVAIENVTGLAFPEAIVKGDRPPQNTFDRSPGSQLAARVLELDAPSADKRRGASQAMVKALQDDGLQADEQKKLVAALVQLAGDASMRALTANGRLNLLLVLAEISAASWDREGWIDLKAGARRAVGDLARREASGQTNIGADTKEYFNVLKRSLGIAAPPGQTVYPHFVAMTREQAVDLSLSLQAIGWTVSRIERVKAGPDRNEVRYNPELDVDRNAAELLAADLRAAGQDATAVPLEIEAGELEIWLR